MKYFFILIFLSSIQMKAQWKSYTTSTNGDTLNRIDKNSWKQGPWVVHKEETRGELGFDEQGYFINDKKDGRWVKFSTLGDKIAVENYRFGSLDGKSFYYDRVGRLVRQESWRAIDPNKNMDTVDVYDLIDPTKIVNQVIIKLEGQTVKQGIWNYYDPEIGEIVKTERYFLGKLQTGTNNGNINADEEELQPIGLASKKPTDSSQVKKLPAKPQAILNYEKKHKGNKKFKERNGETSL